MAAPAGAGAGNAYPVGGRDYRTDFTLSLRPYGQLLFFGYGAAPPHEPRVFCVACVNRSGWHINTANAAQQIINVDTHFVTHHAALLPLMQRAQTHPQALQPVVGLDLMQLQQREQQLQQQQQRGQIQQREHNVHVREQDVLRREQNVEHHRRQLVEEHAELQRVQDELRRREQDVTEREQKMVEFSDLALLPLDDEAFCLPAPPEVPNPRRQGQESLTVRVDKSRNSARSDDLQAATLSAVPPVAAASGSESTVSVKHEHKHEQEEHHEQELHSSAPAYQAEAKDAANQFADQFAALSVKLNNVTATGRK